MESESLLQQKFVRFFFLKKSKLEPVDRSTDQAIDWSAPLNCWRLSRALYDPSDDQGFSAQIERLRFNAHRSREQHARTLQKALGPQHLDRRLMVRHFFFKFFFFFFFFFFYRRRLFRTCHLGQDPAATSAQRPPTPANQTEWKCSGGAAIGRPQSSRSAT